MLAVAEGRLHQHSDRLATAETLHELSAGAAGQSSYEVRARLELSGERVHCE